MTLPRAPQRLPAQMAEALGHAVSGFGFLEEALKRAIFSLTRDGLGESADDAALERWLRRMEEIADDSLGTLIDSFLAAARAWGVQDGDTLEAELTRIRLLRNLLCHASWRPGTAPTNTPHLSTPVASVSPKTSRPRTCTPSMARPWIWHTVWS